ncbi:aldo/keto reductase [Desulfatitalea tepidiphila]|uniref:aldo/keto reductase n=1 Tax=Desulfatitalea tepidiphila TaxID=1185843 RepID=UPI0006B646DD|nr:aldo/keto reductase [Desulfatitalea tepidiphila]
MKTEYEGFSRRQFLKTAGAIGAGSLLAGRAAAVSPVDAPVAKQALLDRVPTRPFGRSGRDVSILSLGGMFDIGANQLMLRQAIKWGVTYWDTADCYQAGSEDGIGKYFGKYPEDREKIFLVTKSDARDPEGMNRLLARSLERMKTTYIDLYFIHGLSRINELDDHTRRWVDETKKDGRIKLFGFSTHRNMPEVMQGAARLGWVDGIMTTYNFRNMHTREMQDAVSACADAGVGLVAMKTQARGSWFDWSRSQPEGRALAEHFHRKGWTEEQAKLKAVWQEPRIASICSQMDSMRLLKANMEVAVDPEPLTSAEVEMFQRYAVATAGHYCAGCSGHCQMAETVDIPISDVMRYHMYCRSYGRADWAREQFAALPEAVKSAMARADFTAAEARCPQGMPIGRLMRDAIEDFA